MVVQEIFFKDCLLLRKDQLDQCFSEWVSLPELPASRSRHGCDAFITAGIQYLVVYGGIFAPKIPIQSKDATALNSIFILKMNDLTKGWYQLPNAQLNIMARFVTGGLVKSLTDSFCDMMYIESGNNLFMCSGNYTWTNITFVPYANTALPYVPVGAANLSPCTLE